MIKFFCNCLEMCLKMSIVCVCVCMCVCVLSINARKMSSKQRMPCTVACHFPRFFGSLRLYHSTTNKLTVKKLSIAATWRPIDRRCNSWHSSPDEERNIMFNYRESISANLKLKIFAFFNPFFFCN